MFCKQFSTYAVHIDWCYHSIHKHSRQHAPYDDIGDASSSLRGSTSSLRCYCISVIRDVIVLALLEMLFARHWCPHAVIYGRKRACVNAALFIFLWRSCMLLVIAWYCLLFVIACVPCYLLVFFVSIDLYSAHCVDLFGLHLHIISHLVQQFTMLLLF